MRALAPLLALSLLAAACTSTYRVRPDELGPATAAAGREQRTVPALDEDGRTVDLRVQSIVSRNGPEDDGRLEVLAADGRPTRTVGWVVLGAGLLAGAALASQGSMGSDTPMGWYLAGMVAVPAALVAAPLLIHGYAVGNPER